MLRRPAGEVEENARFSSAESGTGRPAGGRGRRQVGVEEVWQGKTEGAQAADPEQITTRPTGCKPLGRVTIRGHFPTLETPRWRVNG